MKISVELAGEKMGNNEITKGMIRGEMGMRFEIEDDNSQSSHVFVLNNKQVDKLVNLIEKTREGQKQIMENIHVPVSEINTIIEKMDNNPFVKIKSDIQDVDIVDITIPTTQNKE